MTHRKIVIWLRVRSRVFLDITAQQNQINKYQKIESKKRTFRTETLISNIHEICDKWRIKSEKLGREFLLALIVGFGGSMETSYTNAPKTYTNPYQMRILSLSMSLISSVSWQNSPSVKHRVLKIVYKDIFWYCVNQDSEESVFCFKYNHSTSSLKQGCKFQLLSLIEMQKVLFFGCVYLLCYIYVLNYDQL